MATINLGLTTLNGTDAKRNFPSVYNENLNKIDNAFAYSTEEQRIGTWINGKPIYRRIFELKLSSSDFTFVHGMSNIELVTNIYGTFKHNNEYHSINFFNTTTDYMRTWYNSTQIRVKFGNSVIVGDTANVTLEYTKTTD